MPRGLQPDELSAARLAAGLTQQQAANRLGISQPYLALLERGRRPVTARLASRIVQLYGLGPTTIPLDSGPAEMNASSLAAGLASLGYPGFARPARVRTLNPAALLLSAIASRDVEVRVLEALPWLAFQYHNLDWEWLIREAKVRDLQNRLGFVVTLARQVAEIRRDALALSRLQEAEAILDRARLAREDTLCQTGLPDAERRWLRRTRPTQARRWNLLTDLQAQRLPYAA